MLHDVLIDGAGDHTSQIDLVLVGNKGIYVVEVKTFPDARIYGDTQKSQWYYYSYGRKYEIYSPLRQNKKHVEYLKDFLQTFGDVPCFSIVAMICTDFKISGHMEENTVICSSLPAMERGLYKIAEGKPEVFDDVKKQEIYEFIKNNQHLGREARRAHKQDVVAYKEDLQAMKTQKICPYCKMQLVLRRGKNGEFYGCRNFPQCRYTLNK